MEEKEESAKHIEFGKFAEDLAAEQYTAEGYAILERNWRLGKTEIDIIARKDDIIAFIEVKARKKDTTEPVEAVNRAKRKRMIMAADVYLKFQPGHCNYRFDIFALKGNQKEYEVEIIKDAFLSFIF